MLSHAAPQSKLVLVCTFIFGLTVVQAHSQIFFLCWVNKSCTVFLHSVASEAPGGKVDACSHISVVCSVRNVQVGLGRIRVPLSWRRFHALLLLFIDFLNSADSYIIAVVKCRLQLWSYVNQKSVSGDGAVFPTRLVDKLSQS